MKKQYYIDLKSISIDWLKQCFENSVLLPSQQILTVEINERFSVLKQMGMNNLCDIQDSLEDMKKLIKFAQSSGLSTLYLAVLRREVNSYQPLPRRVIHFPFIQNDIKEKLISMGIKNSVDLFSRVATIGDRKAFILQSGISNDTGEMLAKAVDFMRIRYVNHSFTNLLIHSDYDTVSKVIDTNYKRLYENLRALNANQLYYRGHFSQIDALFLVKDAQVFGSAVELQQLSFSDNN